ncbi:hypothetical protein [Micromonospora sp. NPDC001898]
MATLPGAALTLVAVVIAARTRPATGQEGSGSAPTVTERPSGRRAG